MFQTTYSELLGMLASISRTCIYASCDFGGMIVTGFPYSVRQCISKTRLFLAEIVTNHSHSPLVSKSFSHRKALSTSPSAALTAAFFCVCKRKAKGSIMAPACRVRSAVRKRKCHSNQQGSDRSTAINAFSSKSKNCKTQALNPASPFQRWNRRTTNSQYRASRAGSLFSSTLFKPGRLALRTLAPVSVTRVP